MQKSINVLIIENESLIVDSLQRALSTLEDQYPQFHIKVRTTNCCDEALSKIDRAVTGIPIDLVLLNTDISTVKSEAIGTKLKEHFSTIKLLLLTSKCHNYRINTILNSLNPDGFLIKSDIDFNELVMALERVIIQPPYYSKSVLQLIRNRISTNISLDKIDMSILYHLSKGIRTKNLSEHVCLSHSGIERRKRCLRELFEVDKGDDVLLLERAKSVGLI